MKRFITLSLITILSILIIGATPVAANNYAYEDIDTLIELMAEEQSYMDAAHQMAESARQLGYSEEHEIIITAKEEYGIAYAKWEEYEKQYNILMENWHQKESEYPVATYIWTYFKNLGYSDQVCAGILGNIMAEVGGQTLNIDYTSQKDGYYGMCQWNKTYSEVWGASLEEQCAFLANTIEYEMNTFGYAYKKGFKYQDFLELNNSKQASLAFSKCYERCGSGSYKVRQSNAVVAYNYFTN